MIKIQGKLPRSVYVACSGGADSMVAVDFLSRNHDVEVIFYHHGSEHDSTAQQLVYDFCAERNIECILGGMNSLDKIKPGMSKEDFWRWNRYRFFAQFARPETPVITCHHLDDCVETWIWSSLNGNPSIIPYRRENVIRPFRLNRKKDLELWAQLNGVTYIEDPTNVDTNFTRNYIRHDLMPHALRVNPGLYKVIKKKVIQDVQTF